MKRGRKPKQEIAKVEEKPIAEKVTQVSETELLEYITGNNPKLTQTQKMLFVQTAKAFNLNPVKREIYAVAYADQAGGYRMSLITGYEVYLKRAERSGKLAGWKCWTEGTGPQEKAFIEIHRKDWKQPLTHNVIMQEYNTGKSMWASKPQTMLKKVVMAQGFRLAFPDELGGIPYTADELPDEMGRMPNNITPAQPESIVPEQIPNNVPTEKQLALKDLFGRLQKLNPIIYSTAEITRIIGAEGVTKITELSADVCDKLFAEFTQEYNKEKK